MAKDELNAGFAGTPTEQPEGVRKIAKTATDAVERQTSALAVGAAEHPQTATNSHPRYRRASLPRRLSCRQVVRHKQPAVLEAITMAS